MVVPAGDYELGELKDYANGFVVAHVDSGSCFNLSYKETTGNILDRNSLFITILVNHYREGELPLAERYRVQINTV